MKTEYLGQMEETRVIGDIGDGAPWALDRGNDELMPALSQIEAYLCSGLPETLK